MALPLAGELIGIQEKVETISYAPQVQDTGDLEASTKTITATSEATGTGNSDYSQALTLSKPADARLIVERVAARLAVTIDSMTAGHLYCRVYVDAQDADHRLFDMDWTSPGAQAASQDWSSGAIFNAIKDGAAHTFYFFFWVDSDNAVISLVELWEGVGVGGNTDWSKVLTMTHQGLIGLTGYSDRRGSGSTQMHVSAFDAGGVNAHLAVAGDGYVVPLAVVRNPCVSIKDSVASDLGVLYSIYIVLYNLT